MANEEGLFLEFNGMAAIEPTLSATAPAVAPEGETYGSLLNDLVENGGKSSDALVKLLALFEKQLIMFEKIEEIMSRGSDRRS